MPPIELHIGIETELYLRTNNTSFNQEYPSFSESGLKELGAVVRDHYNAEKGTGLARMRLDFDESRDESRWNRYQERPDDQAFSKWSVTTDVTLIINGNLGNDYR